APARRLDWLGTVRATYQGLWVAIGIGALALVRFDLNGVPPGLQLLMAIPITGASLLGFAAVRYIWSLAAATAGRLLKLPARDPYPTLVVRLLHTAYFLPLHAGMYDENVYSLIRTLEAIAENQFRVPLEEIVTQQQRSGELSAQEVRLLAADGPRRARDALGLLRHVHSQDELRQAVIVAERLVGDHRAVWEAAPHDGEATEASASVKRADDQRKAVLVQTTQGLPHDDYEGPVWRRESRRWIADDLERAATRVEHQLGAAVAARGQVAARISVRASRVAAWLRARESEVLLPASTGIEELHRAIAGGLVSACLGDWTAIECEPCETPQHFSVLQLARRLILPVMLAAAAFGIPVVLDLPSGDATTAVQVSFVGSALLALFAPASALQDATKAMNQALGPDAEPDDTAPGVSTRRS
ncbi:MAG TPA: hypothetical protein VFH80_14775, partial [Solirubrobacteraceae bacterium]|nr:hypothetical protein [Solirubrobacteraceae bacterium]